MMNDGISTVLHSSDRESARTLSKYLLHSFMVHFSKERNNAKHIRYG
ncbi:hypothetical protein GmarT_53040 [Gimesia maris]|uniref:Uncharacterized protein n=1 Tax=Gimesia maris TaxID=122 RepID=A0ABX5YUE0_9PLAN|nr:hypothetical protein Mal35_51060 [Gimesia maris]QEG19404.1 hypothetical protein GmarT_53040 [Gimesia maris]